MLATQNLCLKIMSVKAMAAEIPDEFQYFQYDNLSAGYSGTKGDVAFGSNSEPVYSFGRTSWFKNW